MSEKMNHETYESLVDEIIAKVEKLQEHIKGTIDKFVEPEVISNLEKLLKICDRHIG